MQKDKVSSYRIIPEIARAGFLILPKIETRNDILALALGSNYALGPAMRPTAVTIEVPRFGLWIYKKEVNVVLRTVDLTPHGATGCFRIRFQ